MLSDCFSLNGTRARRRTALVVLLALVLSGCGSSGESPRATSISVSPTSATLTYIGETRNFTAAVLDQNGQTFAGTVTWSSSDEVVLTVDALGMVTAVGNGTATLSAAIGGLTDEVAVRVEQTVDAITTVSGAGQEGVVARALAEPVVVEVDDAGGTGIAGVDVSFSAEHGAVSPMTATTGADGTVSATWTLGAAPGAQTLIASAGGAEVTITAEAVCEGPLALSVGEYRVFAPTPAGGCGITLKADVAGDYYRIAFVGPAKEYRPTVPIALDISVPEAGNSFPFAQLQARMSVGGGALPARPDTAMADDPHVARRIEERERLAGPLARGELRPLADLRYARAALADPPATRDFTFGEPGTLEDNCRLSRTRTADLIAFNEHIAFYAEPDTSQPLNRDNVQVLVDFYGAYGNEVIETYFGGVSDIDGDGRVTVLIDGELPRGITGLVWLGDHLSKDDCAASNEAELMRLQRSWFGPAYFALTGTMVHEAQHIASNHQWLTRYAADPPREAFAGLSGVPVWIEEGRSEIAKEMASRLAWEALGGPQPHQAVTRADFLAHDMRSSNLHGILYVLGGAKQALTIDPYALWRNPYGAGWHVLRFLGDWHGNPGRRPLGDAALFRSLVDATTAVGIGGIEEVTGSTWADLMVEYAVATSVAASGAPVMGGVPRYSSYDFTGLNIEGGYFFRHDGRYPWPATMHGEGTEAQLWVRMGVPRRVEGMLAQNGLRIHDFRAEQAGETAVIRIEGPDHARVVVVRLPDQE